MIDLMQPRYKVIADYPGNLLPVGEVLELQQWVTEDYRFRYMDSNEEYYYLSQSTLDRCNANFKKLEWWEERKPEEMPEYVKKGNLVIKTKEWLSDDDPHEPQLYFTFDNDELGHYPHNGYSPATKEEYEAFISQTSKTV